MFGLKLFCVLNNINKHKIHIIRIIFRKHNNGILNVFKTYFLKINFKNRNQTCC